jgi:hypothetical protein
MLTKHLTIQTAGESNGAVRNKNDVIVGFIIRENAKRQAHLCTRFEWIEYRTNSLHMNRVFRLDDHVHKVFDASSQRHSRYLVNFLALKLRQACSNV